jgi:D-xylose transport system ATP-binding protein
MKILSGVWPFGSYEGDLVLADGQSGTRVAQFASTPDAHAAGIAMIHQELAVFPQLTVGEHLELDQLPAWIDWTTLHRRAQAFLDELGFGLRSETRVGDLSVGGRQLVEIARALYRDARILIFDEPTSALTDQEVRVLYTLVEKLKAQGRGIIYITHRLDEVFRLADRMVILRDGKSVAEAPTRRTDGTAIARAELEPQLIAWMVGRQIHDIYPPRAQPPAGAAAQPELLRVDRDAGLLTALRNEDADMVNFLMRHPRTKVVRLDPAFERIYATIESPHVAQLIYALA